MTFERKTRDMRYGADQKQKTHERIVADAAKLFRAEGYEGCGVDAVMKSAGLTAGGFYAHFKDKDALLAEALERCWAESAQKLSQTSGGAPDGDDAALQWMDSYLSEGHRDQPGAGCTLPTLAGEVPRQPKAVRTAFTRAIRSYLDDLAQHMPGGTPGERGEQAIAALAAAAGAMLIARAVDDDKFSEQILRVMRKTLRGRFVRPRSKRNRPGRKAKGLATSKGGRT
jgi:TetR/AcrR family transcriptional repressor of nem operon